MSTIQLRSSVSDLVLEDALPALDFIVQDKFARYSPFHEKVFNVREMRTGIAQSTQVSGFTAAQYVGEAEEIPMQKRWQGYAKTYTAVKLAIMCGQSQEIIDDLEYDVLSDNASQLADAVMESIELASADIFNSGFSTTGPDGKVLFATDHPIVAPGEGTASNYLATPADLSSTSLKAMITLLSSQVDMAGKKIHIKPQTLLVPKGEEFNAVEILQSEMIVNTSNDNVNALNSIKSLYGIVPVANPYFTDADAFFLAGEKANHKLTFYWRKRPDLSSDYDFRSEVALQKISARFAVGYSDWRGLVGTEGAG
jgi:hypothetical protein